MRSTLLAHAKAFVSHGIPFIFDPGQTTPLFSGDELLALTRAAACVAFSDYEALMIEEHTSLSPAELSRLTGAVFCTHGSQGSSVWQKGEETVIPAPKVEAADPVGAGDAYRGGLLWGMERGLDAVSCAIAGTVMGAAKATAAGPSYRINADLVEKAVRKGMPFDCRSIG